MTQSNVDQNPLLQSWTGPFEAPPFDAHRARAFPARFRRRAERPSRARSTPSRQTRSRRPSPIRSRRWSAAGAASIASRSVFFNLAGAATNDELQAIEREIAPILSRHRSETYLNEALFNRIDALKAEEDKLGLSAEQARVLERYHLNFTRAGAGLRPRGQGAPRRDRRAAGDPRRAIRPECAGRRKSLAHAAWTRRILTACRIFSSQARRASPPSAAIRQHLAVTLSRSSIEPFLQFSARRDLRENAFRAWAARGENGGATDNRAIAAEMVRLRAERARLLGYEFYAHFRLADTMAKTPHAALDLLESVWAPGVASARKEEEALQAIVAERGRQFQGRALGLALFRREAAQGRVRSR